MPGPTWLQSENGPAISATNPLPVQGAGGAAGTAVPVVEQAPTTTGNSVTISNGGSLSGALAVPSGSVVRGIVTPAAWTTAALSFDVSQDGSTFESLRTADGTEFAISPLPTTAFVPFPTMLGVVKIKLRSGLVGATVNQGADRIFSVVTG